MADELHAVELLHLQLPLVAPFRSAHNTTAVKDALLVRVETSAGVGWGECTAQVTPEYDGETLDGARVSLRDELLPRAFAGAGFSDVPGCNAARAALECALLDARLRAAGVALATWLGAERAFVDAGVAVGLVDDLDELMRLVRAYADAGYRRIKLKIEPGHDVGVLRAVRAEVDPDVELAADANGSYTLDGARQLFGAIDELGLQCVEQPCAADDIDAPARLVAEFATPICLDETISGVAAVPQVIDQRACDAVAVKVGRLGIGDATRAQALTAAAGLGALPGGMIETGIGRAALLAVAALPGFTMTGDCSASERFFGVDGDITEPFVVEAGRLRVPTAPGLGVEPIPERIARYTIARERITAAGATN